MKTSAFMAWYRAAPTLFINVFTERFNYGLALRVWGKPDFRILLDGDHTAVDWLWFHFRRKRVLPFLHM